MQAYVDDIWTRTRQVRIGFLVGLIVGALAGWFFHGVISFIVRFFFIIILLIPFIVALIAWWRLRRQVDRVRAERAASDDWSPSPMRPTPQRRRRDPMDAGTVITVESLDTWDAPDPQSARSRGPEE